MIRTYFYPRTKIGKISFYLVLLGVLLMYIPYWIAIGFRISIPIAFGFVSMGLIVIFGVASIFSIIKYKDYSILLLISSLLGILGILFLIGEFVFPH